HCDGDPLEGLVGEGAVAQLRAEARVAAQRRRRTGEHPEEVGQLASRGQRPAQDRDRAFRRGELVVDLEPAHGDLLHGNAFAEGGRWPASMPWPTKSNLLTVSKCRSDTPG